LLSLENGGEVGDVKVRVAVLVDVRSGLLCWELTELEEDEKK
jgi:hypothetical protein